MELTVNLRFEQIIALIRQLPVNQVLKLKVEIDKKIAEPKSVREKSEFQKFLLGGPVMSGEQYNEFKENRKKFNAWRQE
ncbi:MAG: hypothetical protein KKA07_01195 [Bacteroidetes bacterium]|nr:hypothetical protein [Bacteroidota bacterium]MBU1717664.1 hypothetical protein [Bacteroidota bacterium]